MFGKKKFSDIRISYSKFITKISSFKPQLWVLNSKCRDLDLRLEGYGTCGINGLFFKGDLKDFISEDWFDRYRLTFTAYQTRGNETAHRHGIF